MLDSAVALLGEKWAVVAFSSGQVCRVEGTAFESAAFSLDLQGSHDCVNPPIPH